VSAAEILLLGGFLYVLAHLLLIGKDAGLLCLSLAVGWLFLCQSRMYVMHEEMLSRWRWPLLLLVGATCSVLALSARRRIRPAWSLLAIAGVAAFFYGSSRWSIAPSLTTERSISICLLAAAVVAVAWYRGNSEAQTTQTIKAVLLPITILFWVLTPIYGFDTSLVERGELRTAGPMSNPNGMGILAAMLVPVALEVWNSSSRKRDRYVWGTALMTCLAMVALSGTRSAIVAVVSVLILIAVIRGSRRQMVRLSVLGSLVAVSYVIVETSGLRELLERYFRTESLLTASGRVEAWNTGIDLLRLRPDFGYGFGTEDLLFEHFRMRFTEHSGLMVHNSYLGLALQVGIPAAAICYLLLFFLAGRGVWTSRKRQRGPTAALVGCLIAGLIIAFSESWLYSAGNSQSLPFWVLVGLLVRNLGDGGAEDRKAESTTRSLAA
jgi:O-antigen ligase